MIEQFIIPLVLLALLAAGLAGMAVQRRRTSHRLLARFGAEYARVIGSSGGRRRGEAGLQARERRLNALAIRPLTPVESDHFTASWRSVQTSFIDRPKDPAAASEADHLLGEVMSRRGYPIGDFEQCSADLSVDHPRVVENYRNIHAIALRQGRGQASPEDLRQAMILYRSLFRELIGAAGRAPATPASV